MQLEQNRADREAIIFEGFVNAYRIATMNVKTRKLRRVIATNLAEQLKAKLNSAAPVLKVREMLLDAAKEKVR